MDSWRISLNISRTLSVVGLAAYGLNAAAFALPSNGKHSQTSQNSVPSPLQNTTSGTGNQSNCSSENLNSCAPSSPMRSLTVDEVKLVMGANTSTSRPSGCNANSCTVQGYRPPSSSGWSTPPSTGSTPPGGSSGGGGGGGSSVGPADVFPSTSAEQQHLENCAKVYGNTQPSSKYTTKFTQLYGFSSRNSSGIVVEDVALTTDTPPATIPPGGTAWVIIEGHTTVVAPLETDLYMYAYPRNNPAGTIGALVHEWYHQNHDTATESSSQYLLNEKNALAAGQAAAAAYAKDNGAKCANQ